MSWPLPSHIYKAPQSGVKVHHLPPNKTYIVQAPPSLTRVLKIDLSNFAWAVDTKNGSPPYFIANNCLNGSKHGDLILIQQIPRPDGHLMAQVIKIIDNTRSYLPKQPLSQPILQNQPTPFHPQNNKVMYEQGNTYMNHQNPGNNYNLPLNPPQTYISPQDSSQKSNLIPQHNQHYQEKPFESQPPNPQLDGRHRNEISTSSLSLGLRQHIHEVFVSNCKTRNDCLSATELKEILDLLSYDYSFFAGLLRAFNGSNDGIYESQFCSTIANMIEDNYEKKVVISFRLFDFFNEGHLTKKGVLYVIKSVYSTLVNMRLPVYENDMKSYSDDLWNTMNLNNLEKISFEDFKAVYSSLQSKLKTIGFISTFEYPLKYAVNGSPIILGSQNFPLALQLMMGIRLSTYNTGDASHLEDFDYAHTEQLDLSTSIFSDKKCLFISYAPKAFKYLRSISGIEEASFVQQFSPEYLIGSLLMGTIQSLRTMISAGASGAQFFITDDRRFLAKTIHTEEKNCALRILKEYCTYMSKNPDTFLCRIYGVYTINNLHILVMGNTLHSKYPMNDIYDLKGSTVGRSSDGPVKKDLNFNRTLYLGPLRNYTMNQIKQDTIFLQGLNICDYSLLVGLRTQNSHEFNDPNPIILEYSGKSPFWSKEYGGMRVLSPQLQPTNEIMYVSIIDILTEYGLGKKAERFIKSFVHEKKGLSVANPIQYRDRFVQYMEKIIK